MLQEQTIKDDARKIYKNAMNDAINYFTSPKDMVTQALFENGIKHRSVFDHVANWQDIDANLYSVPCQGAGV